MLCLAPVVVVDGPGYTTALDPDGLEADPSDQDAVIRRASTLGLDPNATLTWVEVVTRRVADTTRTTPVQGMAPKSINARLRHPEYAPTGSWPSVPDP